MEILLGFLPWLLYFLFSDPEHALLGTVLALGAQVVLGRSGLKKKRILDWVTLTYFIALVIAFNLGDPQTVARYAFILSGVTLSLTALGTVAAGVPFTLQYARESVPEEFQESPIFYRVNQILSIVWGATFVLQTILSLLYLEHIGSAGLMNEILPNALVLGAVAFTARFPDWYSTRELSRGGVAALKGMSPLQVLSFQNGQTAYRVFGSGPPLVMLNGSHMTMHNWDTELLEGLSGTRTLYLLDYPGIGQSSYPDPQTVNALGDWLECTMEQLKLERCALLGYSMGGWLAQEYAARHPERVEGLILIATDPGGDQSQPGSEEVLQTLSDTSGTEHERGMRMMGLMFSPDVLAKVGPKLGRIYQAASLQPQLDDHVIEWEDRLAEAWYSSSATRALDIPVLVCGAELDRVVPFENSLLLKDLFPQAELVRFPAAGHGVIYQEPEGLVRETVRFLEQISAIEPS